MRLIQFGPWARREITRLAPPRRNERGLLGRFRGDEKGGVLIELAFSIPILLIIVLGCVDATRYILINQKLDRVAASMADLVSRSESLTQTQLDDFFVAADQIMFPFDLSTGGRVIVSSVTRPVGEAAQVDWQRFDDGSLTVTSDIGTEGGNATLPTGFTIREQENFIISEVYFSFQPMFLDNIFESRTLNQTALRRPRVADLGTVN